MKTRNELLYAISALLVVVAPAEARAQLGDCERIGATATEHTCAHGTNGPFATLGAVVSATGSTPVPQKHAYTTVTLPADGDVYRGELRFRYPVGGYHALWVLGDVQIAVRELGSDTLVPVALEHAVSACPAAISKVYVWDLAGNTNYRIQIGASATEQILFVAENLDDIATLWYPDADGDGFGMDTDEPLITFCEGPADYVENESGDCDDEDAAVHPNPEGDADELSCNGVDDDCDGVVDDPMSAVCGVDGGMQGDAGAPIDAGTPADAAIPTPDSGNDAVDAGSDAGGASPGSADCACRAPGRSHGLHDGAWAIASLFMLAALRARGRARTRRV